MSLGVNLLMLSVMILAVIAVIAGPPVFLLVAGVRRRRRNRSFAATVMIGSGVAICLLYLSVIASRVATVGPYRSGIVSHGTSPEGREYCIVQTYKALGLTGEPYQVSFYMRDADGAWRWQYLAHEDNAWRNVRVSFSGDAVSVYRKGHPVRSLPLQAGDVNRAAMREGDDYLPAAYAADDVLKWHNAKFKF